jgi:hypothetical protein
LGNAVVVSSALQEGAGHVLSLCIRIYCHNKSSPTVVSTAAATVRQAVALLFDHAVMASTTSSSSSSNAGIDGVATGREIAAVMLLQDLLNMCAGEGHAGQICQTCVQWEHACWA